MTGKKSSEIWFQIWYDDVSHERTTFQIFLHSKNHEAGGECVISLFLETNEQRSAIYTCKCICYLQSLCNLP